MKRILLVIGATIGLWLMTAGMVSANGGPHGGVTATTDACAGCHRNHTAPGPGLVLTTSSYNLCQTCHGSAGSGANTNVDDGQYLSTRDDSGTNENVGAANTPDRAPLLAGGFVNYQGAPVTSSHDPLGTATASWGNGVARGATAALAGGGVSCATCHDPHGNTNYRLLKTTVNGVAVSVAQVDEGAAKDYDTEHWGAGSSTFCAACHSTYNKTAAGQGRILDNGNYTHRVDMPYNYLGNANPQTVGVTQGGVTYRLPLATSGGADTQVVCETCHLAHGTSATMTGLASGAFDPFGTANPPGHVPSGDSALLRLNNRGVCEVCHQK